MTPRLERYKVELFLQLCEILEEAEMSNSRQGADMPPELESSEEDVYGSSKYQRPRNVTNHD